jgi:hypothetical protein
MLPPFRFHNRITLLPENSKPRFRLVNLYVTRFWRFRSTESIEKRVKRESYLLAVIVFIAAVDFSRRLIAAAIQSLDELRSLYDAIEESNHPNTPLDISAALN